MEASIYSIPPSGPIEDKHQDNERLKAVTTKMPNELWRVIFSFCPKECRGKFSLVDKNWYRNAYDPTLWDNQSLSFMRLCFRESERMQTAEWKTTKENLKKVCQNNKNLKWVSQQETKGTFDSKKENETLKNRDFKIIGNQCVWSARKENFFELNRQYELHCWDLENLSKEEVIKDGFSATLAQYSETKFFFREFFQSNGYSRHGDQKGLYDIQTKEWQELPEAKSLIFFEKKENLYLTVAPSQKMGNWKVSLTDSGSQTFKEMDYYPPVLEASLIWNSNFLIIKGWIFQSKNVKNYILDVFEIKKTDSFKKLGTLVLNRLDNAVISSVPNFDLSGSLLFVSTYASKSLEARFWVLSDRIVEGPHFNFYDKLSSKEIKKVTLINDLFFTIEREQVNEKLTSLKSIIKFYDLKQIVSSKKSSAASAVGALTLNGFVTRMHVFKPDAFLFVNYVKATGAGYGVLSETLQLYHVEPPSSEKRKNSETQKTTQAKKQKPVGN